MKAFALQPADFDKVPLPAIVHWDFEHFVVVERWSPHGGHDRRSGQRPAAGERRRSSPTASPGWCWPASRGRTFDRRAAERAAAVARLSPRAAGRRRPACSSRSWLASLVLQVLGLAVPVLTKVVVDQVLGAATDGPAADHRARAWRSWCLRSW